MIHLGVSPEAYADIASSLWARFASIFSWRSSKYVLAFLLLVLVAIDIFNMFGMHGYFDCFRAGLLSSFMVAIYAFLLHELIARLSRLPHFMIRILKYCMGLIYLPIQFDIMQTIPYLVYTYALSVIFFVSVYMSADISNELRVENTKLMESLVSHGIRSLSSYLYYHESIEKIVAVCSILLSSSMARYHLYLMKKEIAIKKSVEGLEQGTAREPPRAGGEQRRRKRAEQRSGSL